LPPPAYEDPDDNRPEHDLTLIGGCGCETGGSRPGVPLALVLLAVLVVLPRCRRG
jgi:MYXO-CTERM domain-containing protein